MHDRFEQEFYRSRWQRVLPVGPDGIQPYVRTGRSPAAASALRRVLGRLAGLTPSAIASWRRMAIGMAPSGGAGASAARCCP